MRTLLTWRAQAAALFAITFLSVTPLGLTACSDDTATTTPDAALHDGTASNESMPPEDTTRPGDEAKSPHPDGTTPTPDTGLPTKDVGTTPADASLPYPDQGLPPDFGVPVNPKKVAAVQYGQGQAAVVLPSCAKSPYPDVCAMQKLTADARAAGAQLVVHSEYAIDQKYYEPQPSIGENPGTSKAWPGDTLIKMFSGTARKMQVYLVFDLLTYSGTKPNVKYYNTQIAYNPTGAVVAMHHKFELFGKEKTGLTPGTDVTTFDTPVGKTGLLICADIYGNATLLNKLSNTLKAKLVAVSSYWTVNGAVNWYSTYAGKYKVYAVAANHTHTTDYGSGVFKPDGSALAKSTLTKPNIVFAEIP